MANVDPNGRLPHFHRLHHPAIFDVANWRDELVVANRDPANIGLSFGDIGPWNMIVIVGVDLDGTSVVVVDEGPMGLDLRRIFAKQWWWSFCVNEASNQSKSMYSSVDIDINLF